MTTHEDALAALAAPVTRDSLEGATVETEPRFTKVTVSARIPFRLTEPLAREAARRGITPSQLISDLITDGLAACSQAGDDEVVTISLRDLHRAIDRAAGRAA